MISGARDRRRRVLAWCALVSLVLNVAIIASLLHFAPKLWGAMRGLPNEVPAKELLTLEKRPVATPQPPAPVAQAHAKPIPHVEVPAAPPIHHILSRDDQNAPPQPTSSPRPTTIESRIAADQRGFANTVAKLNAENNPHAIATIDPATQSGPSKSYGFHAPAGMQSASEGNGIITPSQNWHDHGQDCYYAHYEYTYPSGAEETGNIVWPICYEPGSDPFKQGRHEMPFPLPIAGFRLPAGTDLPPIERDVYAHWISEQ
jgi:hypothetical protein